MHYTESLNIWMRKIGFQNKRHLIKYKVWKLKGYCPPFTNIKKGEIIMRSAGRESNPHKSACYNFCRFVFMPKAKIGRSAVVPPAHKIKKVEVFLKFLWIYLYR